MNNHAENVRNFYRKQGAETERERILKMLQGYFDLTLEGDINGNNNPDWDAGFQSAMALIRNKYNHPGENK